MELQSVNLNSNSATSLAIDDHGHKLDSANSAAAQQLHSKEQNLEQSTKRYSSSSDSSSVVTQLVSGAEAAVAVYGQVVADSVNDSKVQKLDLQVQPEISKVLADLSSKSSAQRNADMEMEQAELKVSQQLSSRDREVRAHEQTHAAIGGTYAGAPRFELTSGPDGRMYATSGEVSIDTSPVENDPQATLEKAQVIIRAALSVTDPSAADRQIAAEAKSLALRALSDLREAGGTADVQSNAVHDDQIRVEQERLEREEFKAEAELKEAKQERNAALLQARQESTEESLEVLKEYNVQIHEIQETLRRLNTQLVDSGAFTKVFPEGRFVDQSV